MITIAIPEEPPFLPPLRGIGGIVGILLVYGKGEEEITPEILTRLAERLDGMHKELWEILVEKSR